MTISPSPLLLLLNMGSGFNNVLSHDYDMHNIAYNSQGTIVGTTLNVMVENMSPHNAPITARIQGNFFFFGVF